ncbi:hypothetical protein N780_05820 [Pontibacillus chungwhensis BH030062]|uniref:Uncharacterized protein n=1 Tax=Pontibacillus chungwhensis BH030062 TaxID=1385513 RepID=A0A0A2UPT3_9BACI|nr:hypothetical protein N780_05820 [Pontibacillus chungwhensis BH030062]
MELLNLLKKENFTRISFHDEYNVVQFSNLLELTSNDQLISFMEITPVRLEYYPFEIKPHIICYDELRSKKFFLFR